MRRRGFPTRQFHPSSVLSIDSVGGSLFPKKVLGERIACLLRGINGFVHRARAQSAVRLLADSMTSDLDVFGVKFCAAFASMANRRNDGSFGS